MGIIVCQSLAQLSLQWVLRKNVVTSALIGASRPEQIKDVLARNPWIKENETEWLIDSDAHNLIDISEAVNEISEETVARLWGDLQ